MPDQRSRDARRYEKVSTRLSMSWDRDARPHFEKLEWDALLCGIGVSSLCGAAIGPYQVC
jgi:hypothetical protein